MIASLLADTCTRSSDPPRRGRHTDSRHGNPVHRGVAMRNPRFKPFWLRAEGGEWQGLWEKGVFKKWKRSNLSINDRVFTSRTIRASSIRPASEDLDPPSHRHDASACGSRSAHCIFIAYPQTRRFLPCPQPTASQMVFVGTRFSIGLLMQSGSSY